MSRSTAQELTADDVPALSQVPPRPARWPRSWWSRVQLSPNTHRSFSHAHPRWRGRLHLVGAVVWPVVVAFIAQAAEPGVPRASIVAFGVAMWLMLATSAVVHRRRWDVWTTEVLFRADHTAIFVAVAGTSTPIALLALDGPVRIGMLALAWGLAAVGAVVVWHPAPTPPGFANSAFIGLGVVVAAFTPAARAAVGDGFLPLLIAGGVVYAGGAIMLALKWPDPSPEVFGYHEVWHVLVLVGLAIHTAMIVTQLL